MKQSRVKYYDVAGVISLHDHILSASGGSAGVLKPEALDSAVAAVQATFAGDPLLPSLADVAAGYLFYIVESHPFVDANKRTAPMTALGFLDLNGHVITIESNRRKWNQLMVGVASGKISRERVAEIIASAMDSNPEIEPG